MFKRMKLFMKKSTGKAMALAVAVMALAVPTVASADAIDFTGVSVGINVTDVLTTAISFIDNVIPDWLQLGLGIIIAAVLVGFIFWIVGRVRRAAPGK